jgi:hypothetical protein
MTHAEILDKIDEGKTVAELNSPAWVALKSVVELHGPSIASNGTWCKHCGDVLGTVIAYPCPTIQVIDRPLS